MDSIFSYIPSIYSIRDQHFAPFLFGTHDNQDLKELHISIMKKCYENGDPVTMVYENEIQLTRNLADINNNEIQRLCMTNTDWDVLILGLNNIPETTLLDGYSNIARIPDTKTWYTDYIYIASQRFMKKVVNGDMSIIHTYVYLNTFCTNSKTPIDQHEHCYKTVGRVSNMTQASPAFTSYIWKPSTLL